MHGYGGNQRGVAGGDGGGSPAPAVGDGEESVAALEDRGRSLGVGKGIQESRFPLKRVRPRTPCPWPGLNLGPSVY